MYGIVDDVTVALPSMPTIRGSNGSSCPTGGGDGDFVCQSATQAVANGPYTATHNAVDTGVKRGFYMDVPITSGRITTEAALTTRGTLVFVVNKPSNVICNPGGSSWLFQLNGATGGAVPRQVGGNTYFSAGEILADALSSRPVLITTGTGTRGLLRLSDKTTQSRQIYESETTAATFKRIYKRALN
jgi:type IV pilus assembly protein PilY1